MKLLAPNGPLKGEVELPISKSIANRYQIIAALAGQDFRLPNSTPEDVSVLREALRSDLSEINIGMTGTAMRFLTAYFSVQEARTILLTGDERMKQRPIKDLVDALLCLGADIEYLESHGFPPLRIRGNKLNGGVVELSASVSSQFVSALMMIGPMMEKGLQIKLTGKTLSKPYIDLTAACMLNSGVETKFEDHLISIPQAEYMVAQLNIEADWSAASYFYSLAALKPMSKLLLKGLELNSPQGDSILASWFEQFGISSIQQKNGVEISSTGKFNYPSQMDFADHPDLAQTFAFLAATLGRKLKLTGLDNLRLKETDRIAALQIELEKLGVSVWVEENSMTVSGSISSKKANIKTYHDHRMAMSAAVLSTMVTTEIESPDVVEKSFPTFWSQLQNFGFKIDKH